MEYEEFFNIKTREKLESENIKEREILELLNPKPQYVRNISRMLNMDSSTVIYYLKKLEAKGKIIAKKVKINVYYGLKEVKSEQILGTENDI